MSGEQTKEMVFRSYNLKSDQRTLKLKRTLQGLRSPALVDYRSFRDEVRTVILSRVGVHLILICMNVIVN